MAPLGSTASCRATGEADEGVPYRSSKDGAQEDVVPWILLVLAGLLEVAWASLLPATEGLTRPVPTAAFLAFLTASMLALSKAAETIPLGTAYSVWVGIGAVGAALVGIAFQGDPATPARIAFLMLLVVAITGLKLTSGH
jgi:quaternary ammonium compound-resistance protein SugE